MESLLIELMNCGFLIYQEKDRFVLFKAPTPFDSRQTLTDNIQPNTSKIYFEDFAAALDHAKSLIAWQENRPSVQQMVDCCWCVELMYCHRGLGTKLVDLGEIRSVPYDIAKPEAERRAHGYISESFEEGDIKKWEVKLIPQLKQSTNEPLNQIQI